VSFGAVPATYSICLPNNPSDGRLNESRIYGIYGNRVVRVRRIATDVHDDTQPSVVPHGMYLLLG